MKTPLEELNDANKKGADKTGYDLIGPTFDFSEGFISHTPDFNNIGKVTSQHSTLLGIVISYLQRIFMLKGKGRGIIKIKILILIEFILIHLLKIDI